MISAERINRKSKYGITIVVSKNLMINYIKKKKF